MSDETKSSAGSAGKGAGARDAASKTTNTRAADSAAQAEGGPVVGLTSEGEPSVAVQKRRAQGLHPLILSDDEDGVEVTFQGEKNKRFNSRQLHLGAPYESLTLDRGVAVRVSAETADRIKKDRNLSSYTIGYKNVTPSAQSDE